jgi:hypothetical protein
VTKSTKQLRAALDAAIMGYVKRFEFAHGVKHEWSSNDDLMGILCFGDYFFDISDIVYDVENHLPVNLIFQWQNDGIEAHFNGSEQNINLQSYAKGLRYEGVTK